MEQLLRTRIPLPLASLVNRRSVIGVRNLAHFLVHSLRETQAASNAWLVSDERDYTSLELFQMVAHNRGYPCRAFRFPEAWVRRLGSAVGRRREVDQLTRSLYIDRSAVLEALHWSAPYSVEQQWQ
jgi:nucleoside-diphosphate-sugar epimerase